MSSFPKATAAGPSGLRMDHIKEALNVDKDKNSDFGKILKEFINYLLSGSIPSQIKYYIGGRNLSLWKNRIRILGLLLLGNLSGQDQLAHP